MKKNTVILLILALVLVLIAGGGYYFAMRQNAGGDGQAQPKETDVRDAGSRVTLDAKLTGDIALTGVTDDDVMLLSSDQMKLFARSGKELLAVETGFNEPAAWTRGGCVIAYDRGGKTAVAAKDGKKLYDIRLTENITSAKINSKGFAIVISQGDLHKNSVRVINSKGEEIFKWNSGGLYVIDGDISDNSHDIALSTLDANVAPVKGSVYLFNTGKSTPTASNSFNDTIISNILCSNGNFYGVSDSNLYIFNSGGTLTGSVDYTDRQLKSFDIDGGNAILAFSAGEYGINSRGTVIENYNVRGEVTGQAELESEIKYLDCKGDSIVVNDGDNVGVYNLKCVHQFDVDVERDIKDFRLFADTRYGVTFTNSSTDIVKLK